MKFEPSVYRTPLSTPAATHNVAIRMQGFSSLRSSGRRCSLATPRQFSPPETPALAVQPRGYRAFQSPRSPEAFRHKRILNSAQTTGQEQMRAPFVAADGAAVVRGCGDAESHPATHGFPVVDPLSKRPPKDYIPRAFPAIPGKTDPARPPTIQVGPGAASGSHDRQPKFDAS